MAKIHAVCEYRMAEGYGQTKCGYGIENLPITLDPGEVTCKHCIRRQTISAREAELIKQARNLAYSRATSILRERYRQEFDSLTRDIWIDLLNEETNSNHKCLNEVLVDILGYAA